MPFTLKFRKVQQIFLFCFIFKSRKLFLFGNTALTDSKNGNVSLFSKLPPQSNSFGSIKRMSQWNNYFWRKIGAHFLQYHNLYLVTVSSALIVISNAVNCYDSILSNKLLYWNIDPKDPPIRNFRTKGTSMRAVTSLRGRRVATVLVTALPGGAVTEPP